MNQSPKGNPVSAAWHDLKASFAKLRNLLAVGFAGMLVMNVLFMQAANYSWFLAIPAVLILIAFIWYGFHLLLCSYRLKHEQSLPDKNESLKRLPRLVLTTVLNGLAIGLIPAILITLTVGASLFTYFFAADNALETGTLRAANTAFGAFGLLGIIAAVVYAVYVGLRLSQSSMVALVEDVTAVEALKRSWTLTKGRLWYIFSWAFAFGLVTFVVGIPLGIVDLVFRSVLGGTGLETLASTAGQAFLIAPWGTFLAVNIYQALKQPVAASEPAK